MDNKSSGWKSVINFILNNNQKSFNKKLSKFNKVKRMNVAKNLMTVPDSQLNKSLMNLKRRSRAVMQLRKKSMASNDGHNRTNSNERYSYQSNLVSVRTRTADPLQSKRNTFDPKKSKFYGV